MEWEIRFLGSGDAFGSGGRFQACLHVRAAETELLVDCGASSLIAMRRFGVDPSGIDAVLLSHLHGDHFGGLPFLLLDAQFAHRRRPLVIAGPPGVEARVTAALEVLFPGASAARREFPVRYVEWAERQPVRFGALEATPYRVVHASGAPPFALRLAGGGKAMAYSGDTEWTPVLADAARDADLFVCEAYFFEKRVKSHLDYQTLAAQRGGLGCQRLVLTHMSADMLGHLPLAGVETAEDGRAIRL